MAQIGLLKSIGWTFAKAFTLGRLRVRLRSFGDRVYRVAPPLRITPDAAPGEAAHVIAAPRHIVGKTMRGAEIYVLNMDVEFNMTALRESGDPKLVAALETYLEGVEGDAQG